MEVDTIQKKQFTYKSSQTYKAKRNNLMQEPIPNTIRQQKELDNIFELHNIMQKNKLNYVYRGVFTTNITRKILALVESNLIHKEESKVIKRKIFNLMVEGLQNITRHQADDKNKTSNNYGVFALKKESCKYFLTTGNLVENEMITELSKKIDTVNRLDKEGLKQYYRNILKHGEISDKGGAGLGFIDMARKSGNKLIYSFEKVDDTFSYFYLHLEILSQNSSKNIQKPKYSQKQGEYTKLHKILSKENVIFSFNNYFNQDGMVNLLSIIENQIDNNIRIKKRVYNTMVEMFQNITKHGDNYKNTDEKEAEGLFYISENNNQYILNTGNYIKNDKIEKLSNKIDYINSLSAEKLNEYYEEILFNFEIDSNKEAGLGLIDLRMRTDSKLRYDFQEIDDDFSFYSLRAAISK